MDKLKDLEFFMKLNYNIILNKKSDFYYLFIPELSLIVEDKTLAGAYEKLDNKKEKYFKRVIELDAQGTVKEPVAIVLRKRLFMDLISFFSKSIIILICLFVIFSFMLGSLPDISKKIGYSFAKQLSTEIFTKLDNITIEDKEKIRLKIRKSLQQIKPFVDEFRILFEYDNKSVKDSSKSTDREIVEN